VNDLLGLTAAFHVAGASEVIGALWKIWRVGALKFAQAFYAELLQDMDDAKDRLIDSQNHSKGLESWK